jgi:hypothetical protein
MYSLRASSGSIREASLPSFEAESHCRYSVGFAAWRRWMPGAYVWISWWLWSRII